MTRQPEEFQRQAATHHFVNTRWPHHDCAICGYWTAFIFYQGRAYFDSYCGCSSYRTTPEECTWQDVADHYNMQTNPAVIAQMDAFWHFTPATETP